jgi:hypothetical protein
MINPLMTCSDGRFRGRISYGGSEIRGDKNKRVCDPTVTAAAGLIMRQFLQNPQNSLRAGL